MDRRNSASKCYLTTGLLNRYINQAQLPTKKKPFSAILNRPYSYEASLILPQEVYDLAWKNVEEKISSFSYWKVYAPLLTILDGDFLNGYIKTGDVLILSERRTETGELDTSSFSLVNGTLRLELARDVYERCGLQGKPIQFGERKHVSSRFVVEYDLRSPSMVHGKKGFERLVWAAKKVLTEPVKWLFCDLMKLKTKSEHTDDLPPLLRKYDPVRRICLPETKSLSSILVPPLAIGSSEDLSLLEEHYTELSEYLALLSMSSPLLSRGQDGNTYFSRYEVPSSAESAKEMDLVKIEWTGFLPALFLTNVLANFISHLPTTPDSFLVFSVSAFHTDPIHSIDGYTILVPPMVSRTARQDENKPTETDEPFEVAAGQNTSNGVSREFILWEYEDGAV